MKHYREIDILRGIAIIMVFLGHAVIVYPINLENVAWCRGLVAFISAHAAFLYCGGILFSPKKYICRYGSEENTKIAYSLYSI